MSAPAANSADDAEKGTMSRRGMYTENVDGALDQPVTHTPRRPPHRLGNPTPLGLMGFASTTLVLSLFNLNAAHIHAPNVVVGLALFFGGLAQLLAGMWEFAVGNTFGATAFSAYGGFWLSYAAILIPASGITDAYKGDDAELGNALGIYLWSWFIFTLLMTIAATRRHIAIVVLLLLLTITFALLAAAEMKGSATLTHAGGGLGAIVAFIAYYIALAELLHPDDAWFTLPLGHIRKRAD